MLETASRAGRWSCWVPIAASVSDLEPPRLRGRSRSCWRRDVESWQRYHRIVDALERDDIERSRATPLEVKLAQALEMMAEGWRLQGAKLERGHPDATAEEIDQFFTDCLRADD